MLRAGIIGLGVGEQHIVGFNAHPECRVTQLCDCDAERLRAVSARYPEARTSTDPQALLTAPDLDVISIASYDQDHAAQVLTALAYGKHVFVEKPLCLREADARAIRAALAARPGLHLSSNLILRRCPRFQWLREQVRAGRLGQVFCLEADYLYGRLHKLTEGWRGRIPEYSVMLGGGIHTIDLVLWLLDERPTVASCFGSRVCARGSAFHGYDFEVGLLRFPSGAVAKVAANFGCVFPHFHRVEVFGTAATFVNGRDEAWLYRSRDPATPPERVTLAYPGVGKGDLIPSFVAAVLGRGPAEVTAEDVFACMSVGFALDRALAQDQTVAIDYR